MYKEELGLYFQKVDIIVDAIFTFVDYDNLQNPLQLIKRRFSYPFECKSSILFNF